MGEDGAPLEPKRASTPAFTNDRQLAFLCAAGAGAYVAIALLTPWMPQSVAVGVPFLLFPLLFIARKKQPLALGRLDRSFVLSVASYGPFAIAAAAAAWSAPTFFASLARQVAGPLVMLAWAADTYVHVGAVDFFTKRVVQSEAEARFGARAGLWIQVLVWSGAHVLEWTWLRFVFGDVGAAAYLGAAGVVTGLAYLRWRNVLGLMSGHFAVNVAAAAAAVALYG